jgi:hypothetical protein
MNLDELDALRAAGEAEGQLLEFKAGDSLGRQSAQRLELVKDVTGMANAAGGRIIYGLGQVAGPNGAIVAGDLATVADAAITPDWITQVLSSNSAPPLRGVEIREIPVPAARGGGRLLVLNVEQAATAHQCTIDRKYYQRFNATVEPMLDHQIRDVMNRRSAPVVDVAMHSRRFKESSSLHVYDIDFTLTNSGIVSLTDWALEFDVPTVAWVPELQVSSAPIDRKGVRVDDAPYYRCTLHSQALEPVTPLHPGQSLSPGADRGVILARLVVRSDTEDRLLGKRLQWRLYMPNAKPLFGQLPYREWSQF